MNPEKETFSNLRAEFIKVLADPTRLDLLDYLKDGEKCVCEIYPVFKKAQSTMSKHLVLLYKAGFLARRIEGVKTMYSIKRPEVFQILKDIVLINQFLQI